MLRHGPKVFFSQILSLIKAYCRLSHLQADPALLTSLSVHRVLVTAVLVAAKWLDDSYFNNAYYAKARYIPATEDCAVCFNWPVRSALRLSVPQHDRAQM